MVIKHTMAAQRHPRVLIQALRLWICCMRFHYCEICTNTVPLKEKWSVTYRYNLFSMSSCDP